MRDRFEKLKAASVEGGIEDLVCQHFEDFAESRERMTWPDVAGEGREILNALYDLEIEEDSDIDAVYHGIAAAAAATVFAAVGRAFGVPTEVARIALGEWEDPTGDEYPPPVTSEKFAKILVEATEFHRKLVAGDFSAEIERELDSMPKS